MDNIQASVAESYSIRIIKIERLYQGEGQNYSLVDDQENKYILKVYENGEELLALITALLKHLEKSTLTIQFPRPVKNIDGKAYTLHAGKSFVVFEWIEGQIIGQVSTKKAEALGAAVSALDHRLHEFYQAHAWDYSKYEDSIWNVTNVHQYDEDLKTIKGLLGDSYSLIKHTIADFDQEYPAVQDALGRSLIHNDINPGNLIYDQAQELSGIIDFTEISHTHRICEVGVALAYIMQIGGSRHLEIGQSFIQGYKKGYRFTKSEQAVLLLFTKIRLSMTIIYNTKQLYIRGEVTDTQARFIRDAKRMLSILSRMTNYEFVEKLFLVAKSSWQ